jgi:hypothetical protein
MKKSSIKAVLAPLLFWLLGMQFVQADSAQKPLSGQYEVVAIRKASLVHAGPHDISLEPVIPGSRVRFGESLEWLWDKSCTSWSLQSAGGPVLPVDDDMLSDTQVTAARLNEEVPDHRLNEHLVLRCGPSSTGHILRVDDRVFITPSPSGQSYLVMEKIPSEEEIMAVQSALSHMNFYDGNASGAMDKSTRRALALLAGSLGADYDFSSSALSNNLLEAMGLHQFVSSEPVPSWSDEQVANEMRRFRFFESVKEGGKSYLIVSEFFETGQSWPSLEDPQEQTENPAYQRLLAIRSFLQHLPNVEFSALAGQLRLLKLERQGDWLCAIGLGCYPKGFVVGLGPVEADNTAQVCELFQRNGWFCGAPNQKSKQD